MLVKFILYILLRDLLTISGVTPFSGPYSRRIRPVLLPVEQARMAASEEPSHFAVHVFVSHDPMIARALLPDLFSDFPESAWKLAPLIELPPRPQERPDARNVAWRDPREVVGRYVLPEPVACGTTLLDISEQFGEEFGILRKYQAQFTVFPQEFREDEGYPPWHDRALPWNTTLADVRLLDLDALETGSAGSAEISKAYAPVLHLVLETKAAALVRIVSSRFLDKEFGEPYRLFCDLWNRYDSFWHCHGRKSDYSQLASSLTAWRRATFAHAYLTRQREKGRLGPENDELRTKMQRVEEIRALKRQGGLPLEDKWRLGTELSSFLVPRIRQIEANEANGKEQLRDLSAFVTQWENWIVHKDYQSFELRMLEQDEVEPRVASVFRQRRQEITDWKSSEGRQLLQASVENEYYAARPWLTEEDRARCERDRLQTLERAGRRPQTVAGHADATIGHSPTPSAGIQAHSMRSPDGNLVADRSVFTVSSGSLLWGQILCHYYAMSHPGYTENADHVPPKLEGGTIHQHLFTYRSAARNGQWKVRQYSMRGTVGDADPDAPGWHVGWILYHEDTDPAEALERVRALDGTGPGAVSNGNRHTDKVSCLWPSFLRKIKLTSHRTCCTLDATTGPTTLGTTWRLSSSSGQSQRSVRSREPRIRMLFPSATCRQVAT